MTTTTPPPPPDDPEDQPPAPAEIPPSEPPAQPAAVSPQPPSGLRSRVFWMRTTERAVKTAAQVLVVALVADRTAGGGVDVSSVDWWRVLGMAAGGALLSVLTSLATRPLGSDPNTPSAVD